MKSDLSLYQRDARFFRAMANAKRLQILDILSESSKTFSQIVGLMLIRKSNVSQHLKILKGIGLVVEKHNGRNAVYTIKSPLIFVLKKIHRHLFVK